MLNNKFILINIKKIITLIFLIFCIIVLLHLYDNIPYHNFDEVPEGFGGMRIGNLQVKIDVQGLTTDVKSYIDMIKTGDLGSNRRGQVVGEQLAKASIRTFILIGISIPLALIGGVLKGVIDSKKLDKRKKGFKLLSTIFFLSIPDIFTIVLLQGFAVFLFRNNIRLFSVVVNGSPSSYVLPIIVLTIIPLNYISRISALAIEETYNKPYIQTIIGKGSSKRRILWVHVFRNAIIEILGSFSSVVAMIFSSLILVEYMFSYPGLAYTMFQYYGDKNVVIASAIIFACLYYVIDLLFNGCKEVLVTNKG